MHLSIFMGMGSFVTLCNVLGLSIVFWRLVLVEALIHVGEVRIFGRIAFVILIHVLQAPLQRKVIRFDLLMLLEHLAILFLVQVPLVWPVLPSDRMEGTSLLLGNFVKHNRKQFYSCTEMGVRVLWAYISPGL